MLAMHRLLDDYSVHDVVGELTLEIYRVVPWPHGALPALRSRWLRSIARWGIEIVLADR